MICMICDDQQKDLEAIEKIVSKYANEHPDVLMDIRCFSNSFEMMDFIEKNGVPEIAILDIFMPGILGTDVAKQIRSMGREETDIIFLTTSSDFAVEAFSMHASDYITKPYTEKRITEILERVTAKRKNKIYMPVRCGNELRRIDIYSMMYVEVRNHNTEFHLDNGTSLESRMTLKEVRELIKEIDGFIAVGVSYIVNLRFVQSVSEGTLIMTNGDKVPIPRRLRASVKALYFDFYTKEATGR